MTCMNHIYDHDSHLTKLYHEIISKKMIIIRGKRRVQFQLYIYPKSHSLYDKCITLMTNTFQAFYIFLMYNSVTLKIFNR